MPTQPIRGQAGNRKIVRKKLTDTTPSNAPVLMMIRTATATGSRLIATLHTTLDTSLDEVRVQLVHLASAAKRYPVAPGPPQPSATKRDLGAPVNLTQAEVDAIIAAPLHPFDVSSPFRFVCRGGSLVLPASKEKQLTVAQVLPILPNAGLSTNPKFEFTPAPALIVRKKPPTKKRQWDFLPVCDADGGEAAEERDPYANGMCEAICCLFVSQGDFSTEAHSEAVLLERLMMQNVETYGRHPTPKQLATILNKWNANVADFVGRTVLHEAAFDGNIHLVSFLLATSFVKVDIADAQGNTALHLAVGRGHLDVVVALLEAHASLTIQNTSRSETPLHVALNCLHDGLVDALCRHAARQGMTRQEFDTFVDSNGRTPAQLFQHLSPTFAQLCRDGNLAAMKALHDHFLFPREAVLARNRLNGETALHDAVLSGNLEAVEFLVTKLYFSVTAEDCSDWSKRTPLHRAAANGYTDIVQFLVEHKMDMTVLDSMKRTALHSALYGGHWETAEYFVSYLCGSTAGKSIGVGIFNEVDANGHTPLHIIAAGGPVHLAEALLRNGASVDTRISTKVKSRTRRSGELPPNTTSDRFARYRFWRLNRLRYSRGLRHRKKAPKPLYSEVVLDWTSSSPLRCAVLRNGKAAAQRGAMVALLLSKGAGRHAEWDTIEEIRELLILLLEREEYECAASLVKLLGAAASREVEVLTHFCESANDSAVRFLVERRVGCEIPVEYSADATKVLPLAAAAKGGHLKTVEFLLTHGGFPAVQGSGSSTPIMQAVLGNHGPVVHALLANGALVGVQPNSNDGLTPMHLAAVNGYADIVQGLLGFKADPNSTCEGVPTLWACLHAAPSKPTETLKTASGKKNMLDRSSAHHRFTMTAMALCKAGSSTMEGAMHPTEYLHLAASKGMWDVVQVLVNNLLSLSSSTLNGIVATTPQSASRKTVTVQPKRPPTKKTDQSQAQQRWSVPVPAPTQQTTQRKRTLHPRKTEPFERYVYTPPNINLPRHRHKVRDVFSFAAEHNQIELIETLLIDGGLRPWGVIDQRGWTCTDYAIDTGSYRAALLLIMAGVLPTQTGWLRSRGKPTVELLSTVRHLAPRFHDIAQVAMKGKRRQVTAADARAVVDGNEAHKLRRLLLATASVAATCTAKKKSGGGEIAITESMIDRTLLCELTAMGDTVLVKDAVHALLRKHRVDDLSTAGDWASEMLSIAIEHHHFSVAHLLLKSHNVSGTDVFSVSGKKTSALMTAIVTNAEDSILERILHDGVSDNIDRPLSLTKLQVKILLAQLKSRGGNLKQCKEFANSQLTPMTLACALGQSTTVGLLIQLAGADPNASRGGVELLRALSLPIPGATCNPRSLTACGHAENAATIFKLLLGAGLKLVVPDTTSCSTAAADPFALVALATKGFISQLLHVLQDIGVPRLSDGINATEKVVAALVAQGATTALRSLFVDGVTRIAATEDEPTQAPEKVSLNWKSHPGILSSAIAADAFDTTALLLSLGAPLLLSHPTTSKRHVEHHRCKSKTPCADLLLLATNSQVTSRWHGSALHAAVDTGRYSLLKHLLETAEFNVNADVNGQTPLSIALLGGAAHIAALLVSYGAISVGADASPSSIFNAIAVTTSTRGPTKLAEHFPGWLQLCLRDTSTRVDGALTSPQTTILTPPKLEGGASPLLSFSHRMMAEVGNQKRFVLQKQGYALVDCTPMVFAVCCGNEDALRQLVANGANPLNATSFVQPLAVPRQRQGQFRTGKKWTVSPKPSTLPGPAIAQPQRQRPRGFRAPSSNTKQRISESTQVAHTVGDTFAVTPLYVAFALLSTTTEGSNERHTYTKLVKYLLRHSGLDLAVITVYITVCVKMSLDELLTAVLDAGVTAVQRSQFASKDNNAARDGDRFIRAVSQAPPLFEKVFGADRHPLHAAVKNRASSSREYLIALIRHCQRLEVEEAADADGRTTVFHAVAAGNITAVEVLITLQVPITSACDLKSAYSPLMVAARYGHINIATRLLKKANLNAKDVRGNTALMHAAARGHQPMVELLLGVQADVDTTNAIGFNAIQVAALSGHETIALPLAQHWTKPSGLVTKRSTALHCAAAGGCVNLVGYLLRSHEEIAVLAKDSEGNTPLYLSYAFGHSKSIRQMLLAHQQRSEPAPESASSISSRIINNDVSLRLYGWLRDLLKMGESVTGRTADKTLFAVRIGDRPYSNRSVSLRDAKFNKKSAVAAEESSHDFDEHNRLAMQMNKLLWFVRCGNTLGIRVLADHNVIDECEALHLAAERGLLDVVQLLLKLNISEVDSLDRKGCTALDRAIRAGHEAVAQFLLAEMNPSSAFLLQTNELQQSLLHRVAASNCAQLIPSIVNKLLAIIGGTAAGTQQPPSSGLQNLAAAENENKVAINQVLEALQQPDALGLTPFEYSLMFGNASTALKLTYAIHQVNGKNNAAVSIPIASDFLTTVPVLSPALRVLMYDMFRIKEVSTSVGFEPRKKGEPKKSHRLTFADLRVLGIQHLKKDRMVANRCEEFFSVDHERVCFKELVPSLNLHLRVKFQFDSIKSLTTKQQVDILTRLNTSVLMGRYAAIDTSKYPISAVSLSVAPSRSAVSLSVDNHVVTESFYVGKDFITTAHLEEALDERFKGEVKLKKREVDAAMQLVTNHLRSMVHPTLQGARIAVDYTTLPQEFSAVSAMSDPSSSSTGEESDDTPTAAAGTKARMLAILEVVVRKGLRFGVVDGLIPQLEDTLKSITEAEMTAVVPSSSLSYSQIVFKYVDLPEGAPVPLQPTPEGGQAITIPFSATSVANVEKALQPLSQVVRRDAVIVQVHQLREAFVADEPGLKFKLEIEGTTLDNLPCASLKQLLENLRRVFIALRRQAASKRGFSAPKLVAESILESAKAVMVLYSTKRPAVARLNGSKLMICITPEETPSTSSIIDSLRKDAADASISKLKNALPNLLADLAQRLATYLPSTTLVVDLPSISSCTDVEDVLAALNVLSFDHSTFVLQPLIKGLSLGWDSKLGSVVRRHVKQLHVVLSRSGGRSTLRLHPGGKLVYEATLLCSQKCLTPRKSTVHVASRFQSAGLLSAQEIASLVVLQLQLVDKSVASMVDRTKAFGCWCEARGGHTRHIVAGSPRCCFTIVARNILNRACTEGGEQFDVTAADSVTETVRVKDRSNGQYSVHFNAPTTAGVLPLHVTLYGQPLPRSPLLINVQPAVIHTPATTVLSTFNTVLVNQPMELKLKLRDQFGNSLTKAVGEGLGVDGPSATNPDGIKVTGFKEEGGGVLSVHFTVSRPSSKCVVCVRLTYRATSHVVAFPVECLTTEQYGQWLRVSCGASLTAPATTGGAAGKGRASPPPSTASPTTPGGRRVIDWTGLFFRKAIRKSYTDRLRKERQQLGVDADTNRILPASVPRSYKGLEALKAKKRGGQKNRSSSNRTNPRK